jgi:cellulose synthase/poly-beta-1,6-N-acetylglucosamine synthase-like glycosyltransferase
VMSPDAIRGAIAAARGPQLAARALVRTSHRESCRSWSSTVTAGKIGLGLICFALVGYIAPLWLFGALAIWASLTLVAVTGLRTVAAIVQLRAARRLGQNWQSRRTRSPNNATLPSISILVPLFQESAIASRLIEHLKKIDYPVDKFEILLALEADDDTTADTLKTVEIPHWMQVVRVPPGNLRTKPWAMNYALDFAKGDIIGIYDAEDSPAPDQLRKVAKTFATAPPDVACLQGVLDFYNVRQSWLTRCFTIDYAIWFRLVLPGLVRMGFAIPLGGTTVFMKRDMLEKIGRWDAHNVTEDADLGIRLARRGYKTAFVPSVTFEEATATIPAWLRQRSRWIKGYAMTWAVHMREPLRLWRDLGPKRFFGFQILFLGTLSQFVLAPVLWSFWLVIMGFYHPIEAVAPWHVIVALGALYLLAEVSTLAVAALSVATPRHRSLIWWVPLMHLYFPLSAISCWKGAIELVTRPFFWDKTSHGLSVSPANSRPILRRFRRPA